MTEDEKKLSDAAAKAKAETVVETEAATDEAPTPTQAELDAVKLGEHHKTAGYKTRQTKAH